MRAWFRIILVSWAMTGVALAATTGKIVGTVTDEGGRPLAGADVVVEGFWLGASSDADGYFAILNVPPGTHRVTANYIGYRSVTQTGVLVWVDLTTHLAFALPQEALELGAIEVVARRSDLERDVTFTVKNVAAEDIARMPVTTVNDVVGLQAGVVRSGGTFHVRGGRGNELAYMIDGHRIGDPLMGDVPTDITKDAVQQVELITGTYNAEYGNAMSGIVNVVTKEAFPRHTGSVTYRMTGLGLEEPSDNLNERYVEGSLSGPVPGLLDAGFLVSARLIRQDSYYQSGVLGEDGQPTGRFSGKPFGYDDRNNFFGKLSVRPLQAAKISFSYNYDDRTWQDYDHDYKYIPDSSYVRTRTSHLAAVTFSHSTSSNFFYEVRGSFYRFDYLQNYAGLHYTQYSPGDGRRDNNNDFLITANNLEYEDEHIETYTGKIDLSWQANRSNLIRSGVELKRHLIDYFSIYGPRRLLANQYIDDYRLKPYEGAVYVQDKLEFETLIVNAGLRFDFHEANVKGFATDPNNPTETLTDSELKTQLSPRLGISYPVTDKSVFHFAYGHFFQKPTYEVLYEDLNRKLSVAYPLIGNPNLEPERTISYEFGLHTTFFPGTSVQTTVFSKKIRNLVGVVWQFKQPGVPVPYAYYTNEDFAYVKGFEINLRARRGVLTGGASYTYQIAEGSSSSQTDRYLGAHEIAGRQSLQFYPLSFDQRHTANAHVSIAFEDGEGPFGVLPIVFQRTMTNVLFTYGSGRAFTYNPTRARYQPDLNNARMPATYTFDLEVSKRLRAGPVGFDVLLEIYNLFDRKNVVNVYSVTGKPDYSGPFTPHSYEYDNDPENYGNPRTIYLGLRLSF